MGSTDSDGTYRPDRSDRDTNDEDALREQDWNLRDPNAEGDVEPDDEGKGTDEPSERDSTGEEST